jgi:sec-independent protein translocase protein TatA
MGISVWQLLIILAIVLLLFGAKRLKNIGSDLGGAIKGFRKSMQEGENETGKSDNLEDKDGGRIIDGEVTRKDKDKVE